VIGALVLLAGTSACTPQPPAAKPHAERKGPVGPVPPGLERFYGQELHWGPCEPYATTSDDRAAYQDGRFECARLTVPLDYAQPQGRTITLGLLRSPASDPAHRIGSLVVNPGGPGASGMSAAAGLAGVVAPTDLGKRFDMVGFDPRGIGASQPQLRCLTDREQDAKRLDNDVDQSPAGVAQTEREEQDYASKCNARSGQDLLAHAGTRDVVQDMDVLRSVLGDQKLNYLGYSYGTRIGSEYAERFPGNVRAMVLDGAIDPGQSTVESLVAQGAGFQQAFEAFAAWCANQEPCAVRTDPQRAVGVFQRLTRPLVDHPADAGGGRKLSYPDATTATIQALYSKQLWEPLNTGLQELQEGRGQSLMALADSYYGRSPDGTYSTVTDAFNAIRCVDDQRVTDRGETREADRRYRTSAPILDDGRGPNSALESCAFWPVPVTGDPNPPKVDGKLPPTLVISTTGDPATPYEAGTQLASALHGGLLTFEGNQHTVFLEGNSCVDNTGIRYLVDLTEPERGARCRA
jgi:pimeloyl-ACP methyl ester carboxylesterase